MSGAVERKIVYFDSPGGHNTDAALDTAVAYCRASGIRKIVLASSTGTTALGFVAIPLLAAVLVLQAVFHFRDGLAAHVPTTKVVLERLCAFAGCTIRPLRDVSALSIDASDLQADPAHRGLLILTATLRNRAPDAIGYPGTHEVFNSKARWRQLTED